MMNRRKQTGGFSLVELLVVVAIMALLIGIALPSFRGARDSAKEASVKALQNSAATAIAMFQADQTVGGSLPPSSSDVVSGPNAGKIRDPLSDSGYVRVSGASLLVYALAGPDNRGTAGFKPTGGAWGDMTGGPGSSTGTYVGMYDLASAQAPPRVEPFAGGKLMESIKPIGEIDPDNTMKLGDMERKQRVFVDAFNMPLLYYRARKAARQMITQPGGAVGVYDHRDNAMITGGVDQSGTGNGGFAPVPTPIHFLSSTDYPGSAAFCDDKAQIGSRVAPLYNFDEYIWDRNTPRAAALPVRAGEYLLISPGKDKIFGTTDDVKNW